MKMTESNIDGSVATDLLGQLIELVEPILEGMRAVRVSAAEKMLALRKGKEARP